MSSAIDSRTILSTNGAENLLGRGYALYASRDVKINTCSWGVYPEEEIHEVVEFIGDQVEPVYLDDSILEEPAEEKAGDDRH